MRPLPARRRRRLPLLPLLPLLLGACDGESGLSGKPGGEGGGEGGEGDDSGGPTPGQNLEPFAVLDGTDGDSAGGCLDGGADLDGDGLTDLVVSGPLGNRATLWSGADLGPLGTLQGEVEYDYAGYATAGTDDRSGDAYDDLLIGAIANREAGGNSGKVYLVSGPVPAGAPDTPLADSFATWTGEDAGDYLGAALAPTGDLTGDGQGDLLFGAPGNDNGGAGGGRAYLVAGPVEAGARSITSAWAALSGGSTAALTGAAPPAAAPPPHGAYGSGDAIGQSLAGRSDWSGDGLTDLALGASGDVELGPNTGGVFVWEGPLAPGPGGVADADVRLHGPAMGSYAGTPITEPGDLDHDGYDDLLVSADGQEAGRVYLLSGPLLEGRIDQLARTTFVGEATGDLFGASLHAPIDLDGDGELELLIGAPSSDRRRYEGGAAYLWEGPWSPGTLTVDAASATLDAEADADNLASAISLFGLDRLAVGARWNNSGGLYAGRVYLLDLHTP